MSIVNQKPKYVSADGSVEYELAGFTTDIYSTDVQFGPDSYIDVQSAFGDGSVSVVLYALWRPVAFIVKFDPGSDVKVSGTMNVKQVQPDVPFQVDACEFNPSDKEKLFSYHATSENDIWNEIAGQSGEEVPLYTFRNWRWSDGTGFQ